MGGDGEGKGKGEKGNPPTFCSSLHPCTGELKQLFL